MTRSRTQRSRDCLAAAVLLTTVPLTSSTNAGHDFWPSRPKLEADAVAWTIASADVNGDSVIDLIAGAGGVRVYPGVGDGTFGDRISTHFSGDVRSITEGSFTGGPNVDLAVAVFDQDRIGVIAGNGDGTFAAPIYHDVGESPVSVATGRIDPGPTLDLVVANQGDGTISLLLGLGDGTFVDGNAVAVGGLPTMAILSDVDSDGPLDLVMTSAGIDKVGIAWGHGDGTFASPDYLSTGLSPKSVIVDYLNDDSILDIACANEFGQEVAVFLGLGNRTFGAEISTPVPGQPQQLLSGHWNTDAIVDLACSNSLPGELTLLLGNGDGTYDPSGFAVGILTFGITSDDFDGDEASDIVCHSLWTDRLVLFFGDIAGSLVTEPVAPAPGGPSDVAIGDVTGDAVLDVIVAQQDADLVRILPGDGVGSFGPSIEIGVGDSPNAVTVGDFDGTPPLDISACNLSSNDVTLIRALGGGAFAQPSFHAAGVAPVAIATGQLDGIGAEDVVVANDDGLAVLLADGNGGFGAMTQVASNGPVVSVRVGHVDADGALDIVAGRSQAFVMTLLGVGDGTFDPPINTLGTLTPTGLALGYINHDPHLDVAVGIGNSGIVRLLIGDGDGTFSVGSYTAIGEDIRDMELVDLDGDDELDLVACARTTDDLSISQGLFSAHSLLPSFRHYGTGDGPSGVAIGDLNGDGRPDAVVANVNDGTISVLFGTQGGVTPVDEAAMVGAAPVVLRVFPNPVRRSQSVFFELGAVGPGRVRVFDVQGRVMWSTGNQLTPLPRFIEWDGRDSDGASLPASVYFVELSGTSGAVTSKVVVGR